MVLYEIYSKQWKVMHTYVHRLWLYWPKPYLQLFVRWLMSYLPYLCLFAYSWNFFLFVLYVLYPMFPVNLDCPFFFYCPFSILIRLFIFYISLRNAKINLFSFCFVQCFKNTSPICHYQWLNYFF